MYTSLCSQKHILELQSSLTRAESTNGISTSELGSAEVDKLMRVDRHACIPAGVYPVCTDRCLFVSLEPGFKCDGQSYVLGCVDKLVGVCVDMSVDLSSMGPVWPCVLQKCNY